MTYFTTSLGHKESALAQGSDPDSLMWTYIQTLWARAWAHSQLGNVHEAQEGLMRAIELAEKHNLRSGAADVRRSLGSVALKTGDIPGALRCYEESERIYRELDLDPPPLLWHEQAQARLFAGLVAEPGAPLDHVLAKLRDQPAVPRDMGASELLRASAALLSDDIGLARQMAGSARRWMLKVGCATCIANATIVWLHADTRHALSSGEVPASLALRAIRAAEKMPARQLAAQAATARMLAVRLDIRRGNLKRANKTLAQVPR